MREWPKKIFPPILENHANFPPGKIYSTLFPCDLTLRNEGVSDKAFDIAKSLKYEKSQSNLASMIYNFFIKNLLVEQLKIKLCLIKN